MKSRRNPWPLGIVAAFAVFALGLVVMVGLSLSQRTDLVAHDYYEQEIRYQRQLDRVGHTRDLGAQASLEYDAAAQELRVAMPPAHAKAAPEGRIHLYRPSAAALDRHLPLVPDVQGVTRIGLSDLQPGPWDVQVSWTVDGHEYYLDRRVVVKGGGTKP
jgi:hypothetical protein